MTKSTFKKYLISLIFVAIFPLTASFNHVLAWTNIDGGDHGGADWDISTNTEIGGIHTNVGVFTVEVGATATVKTFDGSNYGIFQVNVTSANILGTLTGNGAGYTYAQGSGGGYINYGASGGSHGGAGGYATNGTTSTNLYDALIAPVLPGGGGGKWTDCNLAYRGGGAVKINSSGTVTVSGSITLNGQNGTCASGAGAGGSLYVIAPTFAGNGTVTADGGTVDDGNSGSGGGGRIAINYSSSITYSGTLRALGGNNGHVGENGTVVALDSSNNDLYVRQTQYWRSAADVEGPSISFHGIIVTNNSTLYLRGHNSNDSDYVGFIFNVTNLTIDTGSSINGVGGGYRTASGPGKGTNSTGGSGGSHGGYGGKNSGGQKSAPYDNFFEPTQAGSGGGNWSMSSGAGGASLKVNASGTSTINGTINLDGAVGNFADGGGAGGTVYLDTTNLVGGGSISAAGAIGGNYDSGSGSGGRIALKYSTSNTFSGTLNVQGAQNAHPAEDGSAFYYNKSTSDIYFKNTSNLYVNPSVDGPTWTFHDIFIQSNASVKVRGYYTTDSDGYGISITARDVTIDSGSSMNADGLGYAQMRGPGRGYTSTGGSGGSYGGVGGRSTGSTSRSAYGSSTDPIDLGSGGGTWDCATGAGGGSIKLLLSGTLSVAGTLSANGQSASCADGGGSGGSINISAGTVAGSGTISTTGGPQVANSDAGSGAGGRIAIKYSVANNFAGTISYTGGHGVNASHWGADGTYQSFGIPNIPSSLTQYKTDGITVITSGSTTGETSVKFAATMSDGQTQTLKEEVEVLPIGVNFTNVPTATSSSYSYTGTPVVGIVTVSGLTDDTNYHWQSRVCDASQICSNWVSYGGNPYDFKVFTNQTPTAPSSLGPSGYANGSSSNLATPTLTFTQSDPDVANSVYFSIQISTVSNFSTQIVYYDSALGSQGSSSFTVGQPLAGGFYTHGSSSQSLANGSYYWRVRSTDSIGAVSDWTTANNGGVAFIIDNDNPTQNATNLNFSNATNGDWTNIEPTFTWTSGTDSGGLLGYCIAISQTNVGDAAPSDDPSVTAGILEGIDDGVVNTSCHYIVTGTTLNISSIAGLNLTNNKKFYISILALDNAGNTYNGPVEDSQNLLSFKYDAVAPTNVTYITAPGGTFSNISDMFFSWPTAGGSSASDTESGILGYQYSLNDTTHWTGLETDTNTSLSTIPIATAPPVYFDQSRDGTNISVGTNIIYFRTVDRAGNTSSSGAYRTASITYGGDAPTFSVDAVLTVTPTTTYDDPLDPTDPDDSANNSFALSWDAASPATNRTISKYYWMVNTTPPATLQTMIDNPGTYFETTSTNVSEQSMPAVVHGANRAYVVAIDDLNNYSPSSYIVQQFDLFTDVPDAPKSFTGSDASIKEASLWRASLVWGSPDYVGLGSLLYTIQRSSDGTNWTTVGTTSGNSYVDTVPSSSRFYWRVGSQDSNGNTSANPTWSNAVTLIPKGSYTSSAELTSGPVVTNLTTKKAKIMWTTGRVSDSKVAYGTTSEHYLDEEPSNSAQTTDHTINLNNLSPGTSYYYVAKWTDEDGNTGSSSEKTFTTESAPIMKEAEVTKVSIDSAIIQFTSIHSVKVKIYYGKSTDFGGLKEVTTASSESSYSVLMEKLDDGTKYYYKLNGFDSEGAEYEGEVHSFETLPRPKVTGVTLQQVAGTAETTIIVSWKSNTGITSVITVYPSSDSSASHDIVDLTLKEGEHSLVISSLLPATAYTLVVKGSDKLGNQAISAPVTFTTSSDTRPPSIINLKVIGGTVPPVGFAAGSVNAQLVVTWDTDEPATSQVEFGEGTGSQYSQKSSEDGNLTANHVVVISGLTPSQVYHLRAISTDSAKNDARSIDTVTIAPKATRSALDLVISNITQIFGSIKILGN